MASLDPSDLAEQLEESREDIEKEHMEARQPFSNNADPAKVLYHDEGSHSLLSDLHRGQPSLLTDCGQRDDITNEERKDRSLISHAFLFPVNFEFTKEDLIRLWIAEGLFQENQSPRDRVEDDASVKFDSFLQREFLVTAGFAPAMDFHQRWLYKFPTSVESLFRHTISDGGYFRSSDGNFSNLEPELVRHLCILCNSLNDTKFNALKRFKNLRTLFVLPDQGGNSFSKVPCDLFSSLMNLTTLNFSHSLLFELPSSIMRLKSIRYIDLSYSPITKLPDSIDNLQNLQTLKLVDCFYLHQLPNGMRNLTNLRHLDFDVGRQLLSMPPGVGNLTHLQTLSAFLIGKEEGCQIRELRNLRNLTGSFCIWGLENVLDLVDIGEAALIDKNFITSLWLSWSGEKAENSPDDEEILEHLRPNLHLQELTILCYGGSKLPTWISDRSYECLVALSLYSFNNCLLLPSIGHLPSLRFLNIKKMNELERIDQLFCRNGGENSQDHAFPSLEILTFEDMPKWAEWTGVQRGDFPSLDSLHLKNCPKLKSLPSLSCLRKSLQILNLCYCQSIMPFLDGEETVSLDLLYIKDCPELKRCFDRSQGQDWPKIAHVNVVMIDDVFWLAKEES